MGLLSFLFNKQDPTTEWLGDPQVDIEFDFDRHALCDVAVGEPIDRLKFLGPSEDPRAARMGTLCYYSRGFAVEFAEGRITGYTLFWVDEQLDQYDPFGGLCLLRGKPITLNDDTEEAEVMTFFGTPYWKDDADDEIILFYEHGDVEWEVELTCDGQLNAIVVQSPPVLADAEQRQYHGVTKPWPPEPVHTTR